MDENGAPHRAVESAGELKKIDTSERENRHLRVLHKVLHKPTPGTLKNDREHPGTTYISQQHTQS